MVGQRWPFSRRHCFCQGPGRSGTRLLGADFDDAGQGPVRPASSRRIAVASPCRRRRFSRVPHTARIRQRRRTLRQHGPDRRRRRPRPLSGWKPHTSEAPLPCKRNICGPRSNAAALTKTLTSMAGTFFASWFPTGETRPYIAEIGNFGQIVPKHDYGAVELAARLSRIDLTDKDITGGVEQNITFGVNWYLPSAGSSDGQPRPRRRRCRRRRQRVFGRQRQPDDPSGPPADPFLSRAALVARLARQCRTGGSEGSCIFSNRRGLGTALFLNLGPSEANICRTSPFGTDKFARHAKYAAQLRPIDACCRATFLSKKRRITLCGSR